MIKTPEQFQRIRHKTVGEVANTKNLESIHIDRKNGVVQLWKNDKN